MASHRSLKWEVVGWGWGGRQDCKFRLVRIKYLGKTELLEGCQLAKMNQCKSRKKNKTRKEMMHYL